MSLIRCGHWKPGSRLGEASVLTAVPLHGGALTIAALFLGPAGLADRVLDVFLPRRRSRLHPNLFPVIHDGSSAQSEIQGRHQFCDLVVMLTVAVAVIGTRDIVVADYKSRPAGGRINRGNLLAEVGR